MRSGVKSGRTIQVLWLAIAGCSSPQGLGHRGEGDPSCNTDADCGSGRRCEQARCIAVDAASGAPGGRDDGGSAGDAEVTLRDAGISQRRRDGGRDTTDAGSSSSAAPDASLDGGVTDASVTDGSDSGDASDAARPCTSPADAAPNPCLGACATFSVTTPVSVLGTGEVFVATTSGPQLGIAADGSAFAGWTTRDATGHSSAHVSRYAPGTGWVERALSGWDEQFGLQIAVSEQGDAMILSEDGAPSDGGQLVTRIRATRHAAGWQPPDVLATDIGPGGALSNAKVAADAQGNFVAAWSSTSAVGSPLGTIAGIALTSSSVRLARYARDAGWEPVIAVEPQEIDGGLPVTPISPAVRVEPGGHAVVAWFEQFEGPWTASGVSVSSWLRVRRYTPGLGWSDTETTPIGQVGTDSTAMGPSVAIDGSGAVVAAWTEGDQSSLVHAKARAFSGGIWGSTVQLDTSPLASGRATQLDTDGRGHFLATWVDRSSGVYASAFTLGGSWSPPVTLSTAVTPPSGSTAYENSAIAMSQSGDAVVTFVESDETTATFALRAVDYDAVRGWGAPVDLSSRLHDSTFYLRVFPRIDDCGNATLLWQETSAGATRMRAARYIPGEGWQRPVTIRSPYTPAGATMTAIAPTGDVAATFQTTDSSGLETLQSTFLEQHR